MKARVKATGEIVKVLQTSNGDYEEFLSHKLYAPEDLEILPIDLRPLAAFVGKQVAEKIDNPDYWEKLKHQYAGMAMQGLMSYVEQITPNKGRSFCDEIVDISFKVAHALVQKLKNE